MCKKKEKKGKGRRLGDSRSLTRGGPRPRAMMAMREGPMNRDQHVVVEAPGRSEATNGERPMNSMARTNEVNAISQLEEAARMR